MREILFRGKTKNLKDVIWVEGSLVRGIRLFDKENATFIYDLATEMSGRGCIGNYWGEEVIPETVGQWTGLVDINGTKIFEGDIVESITGYRFDSGKKRERVDWEIGSCGFEPFSDSCENCHHCGGGFDSQFCEVIGNIHDNPELLKEEK